MKLLITYLHCLHVFTVPRLRMSGDLLSLPIGLNGARRCFTFFYLRDLGRSVK